MKTITTTYNVYEYNELSDAAKEKANQWYLDDPIRAELFKEDCESYLFENFKNSKFNVYFSLGYCQGDGLNIEGSLNLYDFIDIWNASEKEKRTMKFYINNSLQDYKFYKNNRYCYSCKFLDREYIENEVDEFVNELQRLDFENIKIDVIKNFYNDIIDYFENLDCQFEKDGYRYFYEADENEIANCCAANEWYFYENGDFFGGC